MVRRGGRAEDQRRRLGLIAAEGRPCAGFLAVPVRRASARGRRRRAACRPRSCRGASGRAAAPCLLGCARPSGVIRRLHSSWGTTRIARHFHDWEIMMGGKRADKSPEEAGLEAQRRELRSSDPALVPAPRSGGISRADGMDPRRPPRELCRILRAQPAPRLGAGQARHRQGRHRGDYISQHPGDAGGAPRRSHVRRRPQRSQLSPRRCVAGLPSSTMPAPRCCSPTGHSRRRSRMPSRR